MEVFGIWLIVVSLGVGWMIRPAVNMWVRKWEMIELYKICRVNQIAKEKGIALDKEFMKIQIMEKKRGHYYTSFEDKLEAKLTEELRIDPEVEDESKNQENLG